MHLVNLGKHFPSWSLTFFIYKMASLARKLLEVPRFKFQKCAHGRCLRARPPLLFLETICSAPNSISLCRSTFPGFSHLGQGWTLESSWNEHILFPRDLALDLQSCQLESACDWAVTCGFGSFGSDRLLPSVDNQQWQSECREGRTKQSTEQSRQGKWRILATPSPSWKPEAFLTLGSISGLYTASKYRFSPLFFG